MIAFYDLHCSPPTFDFVKFLVMASCNREPGERLHVKILPGPKEGFRNDFLPPDIPWRRKMLENVVVRACDLIENCDVQKIQRGEAAYTIEHSLTTKIFPFNYHPANPMPQYGDREVHDRLKAGENMRVLRAPREAIERAERIAGGRKIVTIITRECEYWEDRNSQIDAWGDFADYLYNKTEYDPIIVRDALFADRPINGLETCPEASNDICILSALLEISEMSFSVWGGTSLLMKLNDRVENYGIVKINVESCPSANLRWLMGLGLSKGQNMPGAKPGQILRWVDDTTDNIIEAFHDIEAVRQGATYA